MKALNLVEVQVPSWLAAAHAANMILLPLDTDLTDSNTGGSARTWTANGNAQISTAQSVFGGGSLLCDGSGDYITTPDHADLEIGSNSFTFSFWVRFASLAAAQRFFHKGLAASNNFSYAAEYNTTGPSFRFYYSSDGTAFTTITKSWSPVVNTWYHVEVSRDGTALRIFIDGTQIGTDETASATFFDGSDGVAIGASTIGVNGLNGYIDDFVFINGLALHSTDFSRPTSAWSTAEIDVFRFATDPGYLNSLSVNYIPNIREVTFNPGAISLGENLGIRTTVTIKFNDHRHIFNGESFDSGTFWGKWRGRYGQTLRGSEVNIYIGHLEHLDKADMENRLYLVDSTQGPEPGNGTYTMVLKDILKLADGDRAQAPAPSNGFLSVDITSTDLNITLSPTGIGSEYPASGYIAIGGNEIAAFTRSGDTMNLGSSPGDRGLFNTTAVAHEAGDRVQLCIYYDGEDVADIIFDLLNTYAGVDSTYLPLTEWQAETAAFLSTVYTALIGEPTSVNDLISELIEHAALAVWWDDEQTSIQLRVLREISTDVGTYSDDNILADTLTITEQPEKRISQVYTYYGKINPLVKDDQLDNYRSTAYATDSDAETEYGGAAIKKIYSRWIPGGGRTAADILNNKFLSRFVDPPRKFSFEVLAQSNLTPTLAAGYNLQSWAIQDETGAEVSAPIQITRVVPAVDKIKVEAEEMLWTEFGDPAVPGVNTLIFDANEDNIDIRERHDQIFGAPNSPQTVNVYIYTGIVIGSTSSSTPAMDTGVWGGAVTLNIFILGRIQGAGGTGGNGGQSSYIASTGGSAGSQGGTALRVQHPINLSYSTGAIWGGGGGGGGGGSVTDGSSFAFGGGGGGGGAGHSAGGIPGTGGFGTDGNGNTGNTGTAGAGGTGGTGGGGILTGGTGGGPGLTGNAGTNGASGSGGAGGTSGYAINGVANVTVVGSPGDIRGLQI